MVQMYIYIIKIKADRKHSLCFCTIMFENVFRITNIGKSEKWSFLFQQFLYLFIIFHIGNIKRYAELSFFHHNIWFPST